MEKNETGMEVLGCDLKPKPIIKKLEEALKRDSVVQLKGYVGSSVDGTLRLYKSLNLENYVEVSKEEVIACVEIPNDNCGRVKVFIPASTRVKFLTQSHARTSVLKSTTCPYHLSQKECDSLIRYIHAVEHDPNFPPGLLEQLRNIHNDCCT